MEKKMIEKYLIERKDIVSKQIEKLNLIIAMFWKKTPKKLKNLNI